MPHIVKIPEKIIKLSQANKIILSDLQEILRNSPFKLDESHQIGLAAGAEKNISGLLMSILRTVGKSDGTTTSDFKEREVTLDAPAYSLRMYYVNLWNLHCRKESSKTIEDIEKSTIEDSDLLVREILIRFFTIALSREMNMRSDGEELLKIIERFIARLREHPELLSTALKDFITSGHSKWIKCLNEMVKTLKELHANTRVITQILNYLTKTRYIITRQLIAEFEPNRKKEEFADGQAELTLHDCESKLLGGSSNDSQSSSLVLLTSVVEGFNATELTSRQKQILLQLNPGSARSELNNSRLKKEQVEDLYKRLHRTNILLEVFRQLDLLCLSLSWLPFAFGMINVDGVVSLLMNYKEYIKILDIEKSRAPALRHDGLKNAFFQYNTIDDHDKITINVSQDFRKLFDANLQQNIARLIYSSVERLCSLQSLLGVSLVNLDILNESRDERQTVVVAAAPSILPGASSPVAKVSPASKPAAEHSGLALLNQLRAFNSQQNPSNSQPGPNPPSPALGKSG